MAGTAALERRAAAQQSSGSANNEPISINWLGGGAPPLDIGVSWGVPWPRGSVRKDQSFTLANSEGKALPLQSWPLAYWPDGSIKWTGFATVTNTPGPLKLTPGRATASERPWLRFTENRDAIDIDTGRLQCRIPRHGAHFIDFMTIAGQVVARRGRLVCTLEDRSDFEKNKALRFEDFVSTIKNVTVEQSGPVRGVVKIEGVHKSETSAREWLPFVVRLYFYAGSEAVRLVHTIVFDGDGQKDFIRGLGLIFAVPMREQVHNRHVRFSGQDDGLCAEPLQPLTGRRVLSLPGNRTDVYPDQLAGKRIPHRDAFDARGQKLMTDWAVWDSYKLVQAGADGFVIQKRTNPQSCWLDANAGHRASGLVFAGDVSGGLAVGVKNFWQSFPASLEIQNAAGEEAQLKVWLWSPDAPAMDLRHYDTKAHDLDSSYEDVQPGFSTPHGVARTSEMTLFPSAGIPAKDDVVKQAKLSQSPPLLAASPQHIHSTKVFGVWSLPDRSTLFKSALEDQLDRAFAMYQKEVDQRHWYGFWNFGDVMHTLDTARHAWRYDVGGFAWDNSELGTDMWLWYSFLRTGRADIFRMAEAMTRHTGEVDVYHLGRFAGLGSRHNVRHWGCGAKEPRISQAAYRRFYYYLTTDERTGDLMHEVLDADFKTTEIDTMRLASPPTQAESVRRPYSQRTRLACIPRQLDDGLGAHRQRQIPRQDHCRHGFHRQLAISSFYGTEQPAGLDPKSGKLYPLEDDPFGTYNLTTNMGGAEVVFELNQLIDHAGWNKAWLQYCRLTQAPKQVVAADMQSGNEGSDAGPACGIRVCANEKCGIRQKSLGSSVWRARSFVQSTAPRRPTSSKSDRRNSRLSTNSVAQSCLQVIEILEMCGDQGPA